MCSDRPIVLCASCTAGCSASSNDPWLLRRDAWRIVVWRALLQLAVNAMMLNCGGEVDPRFGLGPSSNPWASLVPQRTIDHHGTTNFNNRYVQCMLPGGTVAAWTEEMEMEDGFTKRMDEHENVAEDVADREQDYDHTHAKRHKSGD